MRSTFTAAAFGLALLAGIAPVFATLPPEGGPRGIAQRGGARQCPGGQDSECSSLPLPRPRACPGGGQSTPTACCRMNYCGICWTDCPPR